MSTVSCSQTISSSENEEWSCSEECDFAGYEYLSSESSQGSIHIDSDCEATKSQNDEWEVDQFSENQAEGRIHHQSQQHANLDIETGTSCDYQPFNLIPHEKSTKAQIRCNEEEIQNRTKRSRLERICINQAQQQEDIDGSAYTCKFLNVQAGEGSGETGDVPNEYSPKSLMQCFKADTSKHDNGRNKEISNRYMQENQVVRSVENAAQSSS